MERAFAFRPQNWRAPEIIIPAYRKGEETIDPQKDLGELDLTPKFPGKHWYRPEAKYWELINLGKEGHGGVLVLGARYLSPAASGISVTHDLQYYVSGGYYASVSSQRISEFSLGGKPAVLVWQKDYFLVPEIQPFPSAAELKELNSLELRAWNRARHLPKLSGEVVVPLAKAKIKAFQKAMEALEAMNKPLATVAVPGSEKK